MAATDRTPIINLLVTADYEVFLGRNFVSDDEVLFEPTRRMVALCDRLDVPITFFADVCSVWAHRENGLNGFAGAFEAQLREVHRGGHDVQLHLHPHWLFSRFENGQWQISTEKMYLAELGWGEGGPAAPEVIQRGIDYLTDLLGKDDPRYRCIAFRAAGLALQPGEKQLIGELIKRGIRVDSSIAKGLRFDLDTISVDYTRTPAAANWFMSAETGIEAEAAEGLFEIPIATFKAGLRARLGFLQRRARSLKLRRGSGISRAARQTRWANLRTMLAYNLRYVVGNSLFSFSCDTKGYDLPMLLDGFHDYLNRHRESEQVFVALINHPKLMFEPQLELLAGLIERLRERHGGKIRFVTASQVVGMIRR